MSAISIYIYLPVSSRLRTPPATPFGKLLLFSLYSIPTTTLGLGLLYAEVHYLGQNKLVMHAANFPIITPLTYWVNRHLPQWRWRPKTRTSGLGKWAGYSVAKWGCSNLLFILLAGVVGLPYLGVTAGTVVAFGMASYLMNDRKVFPKSSGAE